MRSNLVRSPASERPERVWLTRDSKGEGYRGGAVGSAPGGSVLYQLASVNAVFQGFVQLIGLPLTLFPCSKWPCHLPPALLANQPPHPGSFARATLDASVRCRHGGVP